jgi:hypothetical protein
MQQRISQETLAQMNGKYICRDDAGSLWREAVADGIDMSLIDHALTLTPEQRLEEHQQVINFLLEVQEAGRKHAAR